MKNLQPAASAELYRRAQELMPGGVSHELRFRQPHPLYIEKARGAEKWEVGGRRIIDFKMGSASQLLGHCHPDVVAALQRQASETIFTSDCHRMEIEWAEAINSLYPSAELTRFTSSGTEATMLALMLGRAYTGRPRILRIDGHYHGWHDYLSKGAKAGSNKAVSLGVPKAIQSLAAIVPASLEIIRERLKDHRFGTIILEASGANYGSVPFPPGFLKGVRTLATEARAILVFDEIITGFRWSPGGLQSRDGIVPDLTALAKILTGGLPGGAIAGRANIMALLDPEICWNGLSPPVSHKGTFNASHLVAAGALAAMRHLKTGKPQAQADAMARKLRAGLRTILSDLSIEGAVYGESSTFHIYLGECDGTVRALSPKSIRGMPSSMVEAIRNALLADGVELMSYLSGVTSAAHDDALIDEALGIFESAFRELKLAGVIGKTRRGRTQ